jgi:hypothetical protein
MMDTQESIVLGVVLERQPIDHPWAEWSWRPVAVIPGAAEIAAPVELVRDGDRARFHVATLTLALHRKETEGLRVNLTQPTPSVYVVLRSEEDSDTPVPHLVTACPYEAEDYDLGGEDRVEAVAMPPEVAALVGHFVDCHHVEEKFVKRKRTPHDPRKGEPAPKRRGSAGGTRFG